MNKVQKSSHLNIFSIFLLGGFILTSNVNAADLDKGISALKKGSYKTALEELKPLANKGNIEAQYNVGKVYSARKWSVQDETDAINWFTKAAENKHNFSQFTLGHMYAKEDSVYRDYIKAFAWYSLALSRGNEAARKGRDKVMINMTPEQVSKGQDLYNKLHKKIYDSK